MGTGVAAWERGLQVLRTYTAERGSAAPTLHVVVDGFALGRWVARRRELFRAGVLEVDRVAVLEALPGWSWGRTQRDGFEAGLTHLRSYVTALGSAEVPRAAVIDGFKVGAWVMARRQAQVSGELRPQWAATLEALPGWRWVQHPTPFVWSEGAAVLEEWVTVHGCAVVPPGADFQGLALGTWVSTVCRRHARGALTEVQVVALEALPGWAWGALEGRFQQGLALLREYRAVTGSASPAQFYVDPSGFTLGAWVGRVRTFHRTGVLPPERVAVLEAVPGWQWNPMADQWQAMLEVVRVCAGQHGGIDAVPGDTRVGQATVGVWTANQRVRGHRGRLTPHQAAELESIPGWWWSPPGPGSQLG